MWKVAVSMPCADRPVDRAVEDRGVVLVHAEDEAAVDHHAEVVQPAHGLPVVAVEVLDLALRAQACRVRASRSRRRGCAGPPPRPSRAGAGFRTDCTVPAACHRRPIPRMPSKSAVGEARVAEEVVVEEVEVAARQALDLGERVVDASACRSPCRPRRRPPCSRSRRCAGSRARPRSSSGRGRGGAGSGRGGSAAGRRACAPSER